MNVSIHHCRESMCYIRRESSDGLCTLQKRTTNSITENELLYKIASPRFYRNRPYQNRRLCQYNVPSCPTDMLTHIEWNIGDFVVQPICEFGSTPERICSDHLEFININLETEGTIIDDNGLFCGTQPDFSMRFSSRPIQVQFRSDEEDRFKGFLVTIMCAETEFMFTETVTQVSLFRRDLSTYPSDGMKGSPPRMTSENCTELRGSTPPPVPMVSLLELMYIYFLACD